MDFDELLAKRSPGPAPVRKPIGWCTYRGDVTQGLPTIAGPNYMGEPMFPVEAVYDPETDKTRVGWSLIPPPPAVES